MDSMIYIQDPHVATGKVDELAVSHVGSTGGPWIGHGKAGFAHRVSRPGLDSP